MECIASISGMASFANANIFKMEQIRKADETLTHTKNGENKKILNIIAQSHFNSRHSIHTKLEPNQKYNVHFILSAAVDDYIRWFCLCFQLRSRIILCFFYFCFVAIKGLDKNKTQSQTRNVCYSAEKNIFFSSSVFCAWYSNARAVKWDHHFRDVCVFLCEYIVHNSPDIL